MQIYHARVALSFSFALVNFFVFSLDRKRDGVILKFQTLFMEDGIHYIVPLKDICEKTSFFHFD